MASMKKNSLVQSTQAVLRACEKRGFKVRCKDADLLFECVQDKFDGVEVDAVDADNQPEVIEGAIMTTKENIRSLTCGTPCRRIPRLIDKRLVEVATRNLNSFSVEDGISDEHNLTIALTLIVGSVH